jgi:glycosyltransferase involved in cell wall biosynthesis
VTDPARRSVAVVIPVYNGVRTVEAAIRSALAQDHPGTRVIVVDDGSTDGTAALLAGLPGITVLRQENRGPAAARNVGWRAATDADYVFFLDADCVAPPDWVSRLLLHHEELSTGCVGCVYGLANPDSWLARIIYREFQRRYAFCGEHTYFLGSHGYSFRRETLERMGGFDESYRHASHEDNELGWRLLRASYRLRLVREVAVKHHFPRRVWSYLVTQARHGFWRMKVIRTYPQSALGDEYSSPFDYAQPPLVLFALLLAILAGGGRPTGLAAAAALGAAIVLQAPVATGMRRLGSRRREVLLFSLVLGPLRSLARSLGMVAGVVWFWALGARP